MSKVILMDFSAEWCGPCKIQDPILEELEEKFKGQVEFKKIDVDAKQLWNNFFQFIIYHLSLTSRSDE